MTSQMTSTLIPTLWAGLVFGISFVAQPAKFGATGLSKPVALSVGRRIFRVMHCIESVAAAAAIIIALKAKSVNFHLLTFCSFILVIQICALMPRLSRKVDSIIGGQRVVKSLDHVIFAALEFLKLVSLVLFSGLIIYQ